ncbi:Gibberellin 3-beta-dioxygenase [Quillaja saponaria]|uniref:gibberellin 3beta-dioxygenase n=1 Tax=Quillaja saponaria TaxID=32244 RepID=A0AAD7PSR9_QUISA|nr:Gibberellin 3-beta-dioxygenase [Quillaja saponaria]
MVTLSEAYRDHPLHLHHIIPLDFSSAGTLPETHAWPELDDFATNGCSNGQKSIPVIDLKDPNAMEVIGIACEKWGVFELRNHEIPLNLIEEVDFQAKRFFALPSQNKLKALRSPGGATGYGVARISPFFSKYMWHEGFTIMGSPVDLAKRIWPNDYAPFCDPMENYQKQMKHLSEQLKHLIFNFLDISNEAKNWVGSTNSSGSGCACTAIQLNSYPSCPDPNRAMGLAPHTDTSLFTILHQSNTNGLQIFKDEVGWVPVNPDPTALVVNTGDILHIMSNGRFRSVLHRVMVNGTRPRYSVAYFYSPPLNYVVSASSNGVLKSGELARFHSVTVKEYIGLKAKNLEKALCLITI